MRISDWSSDVCSSDRRVSGQILLRDGFTKNLFDKSRTDNERKTSFRASVVIRPFEWLENYFIYQYTHINEAGSGAAIGGFTPASLNPNKIRRASCRERGCQYV